MLREAPPPDLEPKNLSETLGAGCDSCGSGVWGPSQVVAAQAAPSLPTLLLFPGQESVAICPGDVVAVRGQRGG